MARTPMTARQKEVYDFLVEKAMAGDVTPSLREIGEKFGISSTNGVARHLEALRKKGYITMDPGKARAIRIPGLDLQRTRAGGVSSIPLLGKVAAGLGLLADENREGDVVVDPDLFGGSDDSFALRVRGDSMIEAGIHEGDLVIVRPQRHAKSGEVVVAMVGEEATVKTYVEKRTHIELQPANEAYEPIVIPRDAENFLLLGRVVGLMRRY